MLKYYGKKQKYVEDDNLKNGYNSFSTCADKLRAYSFIYGMCLIYREFTAKIFEYEECGIPALCIDYKALTDSSHTMTGSCLRS